MMQNAIQNCALIRNYEMNSDTNENYMNDIYSTQGLDNTFQGINRFFHYIVYFIITKKSSV